MNGVPNLDHSVNGDANGHTETVNFDIVIVGTGVSGINAAYRIQESLPHVSYTILEGRHELGGTWSLFKYPGIRSDSDLHTYGFSFNPWEKPNPIATGESITQYLRATTQKFGIDKNISFKHRVVGADWRSDEQRWRLEVENEGRRKVYWAKFVVMGTGYYNYEKPLKTHIPGLDRFQGTTVHPQFWPEDLDYKGKRMVVIGSGATAVTILPAVVENGVGSVVQLQRSPSYIMSIAQPKPEDPLPYYQRIMPRWMALKLIRLWFIILPFFLFRICQTFPKFMRSFIRNEARKALPKDFPLDPGLQPKYNPWDQRLCYVPDNDFFNAFHTGKARIVTDTIKTVTEDGIELDGGEKLKADIIVTATGINLQICGGIPMTLDGKPIHLPECYTWRTAMLSGIPNLAIMIGYVNASWTLGADASARLITRLYKHMEAEKYTSVRPQISEDEKKDPVQVLNLKSTYIKSANGSLPQAGRTGPWKPRDNYFQDNWVANWGNLKKGLVFERVAT
ncbi:hypothetical protein GRF29_8g2995921 [Pseudopithomyces chartarum]|uniref:FAD/NAD(P)-binding domain-containing protein n=1 Tax=Pseudopithomyces chartarum TaxID=1892770 RepID=A0AAN6RLN3_9PLEO|nr:hypothetical protein GRF29_8g2995921 [Pseudopithomyces chartarum]